MSKSHDLTLARFARESNLGRSYGVVVYPVPAKAKKAWQPDLSQPPVETLHREIPNKFAEELAAKYNETATKKKTGLRAFVVTDPRLARAEAIAQGAEELFEEIVDGHQDAPSIIVKYRHPSDSSLGFRFITDITGEAIVADDQKADPETILFDLLSDLIYNSTHFRDQLRERIRGRTAREKAAASN